jgi:hypothetical protein
MPSSALCAVSNNPWSAAGRTRSFERTP